jgi:hypothetical protein
MRRLIFVPCASALLHQQLAERFAGDQRTVRVRCLPLLTVLVMVYFCSRSTPSALAGIDAVSALTWLLAASAAATTTALHQCQPMLASYLGSTRP